MSEMTHDPQQDYIASLEAELGREKKRVEVYRIAGEQAIAQVDDLRAQLPTSVPRAEHNRIVGEIVKSLDAERTEFEERIAEMTAEADSNARTAVDLFEQLQLIKQQLKAMTAERDDLKRGLHNYQDMYGEVYQKLAASEARVKELEELGPITFVTHLQDRVRRLEEAVYAKQQIAFMVKELSVAIDQNKVSDGDATDELRGMMHEWENFVDLEWAIFKKEILDYPAHTQGTDGT